MKKNTIVSIVYKIKPLLVKLFPKSLLRYAKKKVLAGTFKEIEQYQILPYNKEQFPFGVNLIGNIRANTGLGQSCRLVAEGLKQANIPFSIYLYNELNGASGKEQTYDDRIRNDLPYGINLIHINPNELGVAFHQLGENVWKHHYNIGFWLWELEEFPEEWVSCFNLFHEIWTPSEFISEALRKKTKKPVKTIPYSVTVEKDCTCDRSFFKLPEDKFLYFMMYDSASVMERKNPMGVIEAFKKAFPIENSSVGLVIKMKQYSKNEMQKIKEALQGYQNIYFVEGDLLKNQVNALLSIVDVVVSLHRAEGFGLVMAEAMLLGTPVIATNWSANTEFMNKNCACMVDATLISLEKDYGPFKRGQRWANPNIAQAADYMKLLFQDKQKYETFRKNGKEYVESKLSKEQVTIAITSALEGLQ